MSHSTPPALPFCRFRSGQSTVSRNTPQRGAQFASECRCFPCRWSSWVSRRDHPNHFNGGEHEATVIRINDVGRAEAINYTQRGIRPQEARSVLPHAIRSMHYRRIPRW